MAADRATKYGSVVGHEVTKIGRRDDGALCGTAGTSSIAAAFRRWFLAGETEARPSLGDEKEDIHALVVRPNGDVEIHDRMGWTKAEGKFHAIGSGAEIAFGALAMGATAEQAVRIAAQFGIGSEASIDVLTQAISALDPVPSPPDESSPQASETDAAEIPAGFTKWEGADVHCPPEIDEETRVQVLYRDGTRSEKTGADSEKAWTFVWGHEDNTTADNNIIAYRIIEAPAEPQAETDTHPPSISDDGKGAEGEATNWEKAQRDLRPEDALTQTERDCLLEFCGLFPDNPVKLSEVSFELLVGLKLITKDRIPTQAGYEAAQRIFDGVANRPLNPVPPTQEIRKWARDVMEQNHEPAPTEAQLQADMALQEESEDAETSPAEPPPQASYAPVNEQEEHPAANFFGKALAHEAQEREQARGLISKLFGGEKKLVTEGAE